jgi:hypothetical protein
MDWWQKNPDFTSKAVLPDSKNEMNDLMQRLSELEKRERERQG